MDAICLAIVADGMRIAESKIPAFPRLHSYGSAIESKVDMGIRLNRYMKSDNTRRRFGQAAKKGVSS